MSELQKRISREQADSTYDTLQRLAEADAKLDPIFIDCRQCGHITLACEDRLCVTCALLRTIDIARRK